MAGTLFVVATPIGHLDDITARALRVLREVAVVAAEDTRRTGNLLRHFGIPTRLVSLHAHNEHTRAPALVERLSRGDSVAIVSDAGTPGISDPGAGLVRLARDRQIRIEAVPGPSAVAAAVSIAGLEEGPFAFLGFPPTRSRDRNSWFAKAKRLHQDAALVFFEAPHRIRQTLRDLTFSGEQPIYLFRELTKVHEETRIGSAESLAEAMDHPQGEFTVVVPQAQVALDQPSAVSREAVIEAFGRLTEKSQLSKRAIAREVGKEFGLSTRQVYELANKSPE
jgi:16S rRNA (cytidine1402-2'-O)-methyltransferase